MAYGKPITWKFQRLPFDSRQCITKEINQGYKEFNGKTVRVSKNI
jgi:hypothetical protein